MTAAIVREWDDEAGWGVLDSAETPGGCFTHFSHIEMDGFRSLRPGQRVELTWEQPGQDGFDYMATRVDP
jgi:CspA family cold shock protein